VKAMILAGDFVLVIFFFEIVSIFWIVVFHITL
jgi:hypothetical protein